MAGRIGCPRGLQYKTSTDPPRRRSAAGFRQVMCGSQRSTTFRRGLTCLCGEQLPAALLFSVHHPIARLEQISALHVPVEYLHGRLGVFLTGGQELSIGRETMDRVQEGLWLSTVVSETALKIGDNLFDVIEVVGKNGQP